MGRAATPPPHLTASYRQQGRDHSPRELASQYRPSRAAQRRKGPQDCSSTPSWRRLRAEGWGCSVKPSLPAHLESGAAEGSLSRRASLPPHTSCFRRPLRPQTPAAGSASALLAEGSDLPTRRAPHCTLSISRCRPLEPTTLCGPGDRAPTLQKRTTPASLARGGAPSLS